MLYTIKTKQFIKSDLDTVWDFISSPKNLNTITPDAMKFETLTELGDKKMYAGQIIEYYVTPFAGIKMHWVTEITHIKDKEYFVDEQRFGPYAMWHHKHFLKTVNGGVEMTDIVHYKMPYGIFGKMAHTLFVKKKLKEIFDFRFKKVDELFNQKN